MLTAAATARVAAAAIVGDRIDRLNIEAAAEGVGSKVDFDAAGFLHQFFFDYERQSSHCKSLVCFF